ncbi:prophage ps1 protein 07 [Lactococcus lactis subsp. lactis]|uniref:HTH domain-containing protein n=3 Tax=Lactococcus lactis TaxID=1358 RepID=A0A5M9Q6X4_LACLH|nr:HTH domain-containing protein [Lactococcus lactis]KAA8703600.1 HTH domain-containing protein [Lactococcus lactis subsp. hordniae]KSU05963.1 prophage ps1 protein 07 [Lactococcus lactis subsp. lactis]MCT3133965.1 HTH domain-containing protein [Lactococcus lactis]
MKLKELQTLDQNIIKTLADHKGIDRAINGKMLAQTLNVDLRTLQSRISSLQKKRCAIGTIEGLGYFIPTDEAERTAGITKKEEMGFSIHDAVSGYTRADLEWITELLEGQ